MATVTVSKRQVPTNAPRQPITRQLLPALSTTVGSKYIVALTGLVLTVFVLGHMAGNLLFSVEEPLEAIAEKVEAIESARIRNAIQQSGLGGKQA